MNLEASRCIPFCLWNSLRVSVLLAFVHGSKGCLTLCRGCSHAGNALVTHLGLPPARGCVRAGGPPARVAATAELGLGGLDSVSSLGFRLGRLQPESFGKPGHYLSATSPSEAGKRSSSLFFSGGFSPF